MKMVGFPARWTAAATKWLLLAGTLAAFATMTSHAAAAGAGANPTPQPVLWYLNNHQQLGVLTVELTPSWYVVAQANVTKSMNTSGWDLIDITANPSLISGGQSAQAYYGAGYLEGYLTAESIWAAWLNSRLNETFKKDALVRQWADDQLAHVESACLNPPFNNSVPEFYAQASLVQQQFQGMVDGYAAARAAAVDKPAYFGALSKHDFFLLNLGDELRSIAGAVHGQIQQPLPGRSSAFVRWTGTDLIIGHNTWRHYSAMLRQHKTYRFGSTTIAMTSYPGLISSTDDWYISPLGMVVVSTANDEMNAESLRLLNASGSFPKFARAMVANYLTQNVTTWMPMFLVENSGTTNAQWLIINTSLPVPNASLALNLQLPAGTIYALEQAPGSASVTQDITDNLRTDGYWAAYNIPFFSQVYSALGYPAQAQGEGGAFWRSSSNSRSNLFKIWYSQIDSVPAACQLMSLNSFFNDSMSLIPGCGPNPCQPNHSAVLTIAARGDLNPVDGIYGALAPIVGAVGAFGAIDAKVTSTNLLMQGTAGEVGILNNMNSVLRSGPTTYGVMPTFKWSAASSNVAATPHVMQPDTFDFGFVPVDVLGLASTIAVPLLEELVADAGAVAFVYTTVFGGGAVLLVSFVISCISARYPNEHVTVDGAS